MGDEKARRVEDALTSLVKILVPPLRSDEENTVDRERRNNALNLAKNIIEGHKNSAIVSDVNHAADLIKKKLLRENESPDKAVQFSNLYSRLLTQPVINQKWAILYLLYQVADADPDEENSSRSGISQFDRDHTLKRYYKKPQPRQWNTGIPSQIETSPLSKLPKLPEQYGQSKDDIQSSHLHERWDGTHSERYPDIAEMPLEGDTNRITAPTESELLRDLPFILQGLSTTHLSFTPSSTLILPGTLPLPLLSLLHTLAEPSLLYRNLSDFVQCPEEGLISQSLRSAISTELRSYLSLIAALEGEIRQAIASWNASGSRSVNGKVGVTLKRCVIWTREATMGLRLMSLISEEAKSKRGGQLITAIHSLSASHGDPFVSAFAERILVQVTQPFYDILRQWIFDGELYDPYHEFFVLEQDNSGNGDKESDPRRAVATSVWADKYKLDDVMVPTIMSGELAKKVFLIGKSLNFIHYGCGDSAWVEAYSKEAPRKLHYGDTATLEKSIDKAYTTTMARLIHLMDEKFRLFEHLRALKKYLLLGQGDFIAVLMESLSSNLDRPAGSQYRHTLTARLEHAVRSSNAQYDSQEVIRRLDARLLELSHGEIGWDVFSLEYKIDAPVDVVITPWANRKYLTVFNFLWRVKRVEFALSSTWRRCMTGARGVLANVDENVSKDWKLARCCVAEMIHFVNELQYYILFEVIESSWDQLQAAIMKPGCTLDDLIAAHTKYLESITHKGLLGSSRHFSTGTREDSFISQLHQILKTMLAYKEAVDGLYSFSVAEFTRNQELSAKLETRTIGGKATRTDHNHHVDHEDSSARPNTAKGIPSHTHERTNTDRTESPFPVSSILAPSGPSDDQMLPTLRLRLGDLATDFRARISTLLGDLAAQPDPDMKFLGMVMNFNNVYTPKRRRRGDGATHRGERKTPVVVAGSGIGAAEGSSVAPAESIVGGAAGDAGKADASSRLAGQAVAGQALAGRDRGRERDAGQ